MNRTPVFITGNENKAFHFSKQIGMDIPHKKLDLVEIQSKNPEEIIERKVLQAYEILQQPVIVDDFCSWFDDYEGLPGPFIKYFIEVEDGLEKLCRMADMLPTRRMTQRGYIAYYDGKQARIFHGELRGVVVDHPRTPNSEAGSYGIDPIFAPDGYRGRTRAELTSDEYGEAYRKVRPIEEIRELLQSI